MVNIMKNNKKVSVLVGLILFCLSAFSVNGADMDTPTFEIPDVESNLIVKVVGFRKTESIVNGIEVPIFTTDTNLLGRMDTGVLCCVVSPKQFANTFFVLVRQPFEMEDLSEVVPSYKLFELGHFYKIPYSIKDLGDGEGTNLYFTLGGGLRLSSGTYTNNNVITTSKLEMAGDTVKALAKRYYVSADEARAEVERLRPLVEKHEEQLNEIKTALREEQERRKKLGKEIMGIYLDDETDKYSMLKKEIYKIGSLHCEAKSEMLNAEKQLQDFKNLSNTTKQLTP
jgi:hypothetical protein